MLDLNFVRNNLPLVEEKLRQRGMDPALVLKDFLEVDAQRRHAITEAETMKARRNRASEEIAKLKKSGQDATAQMSETKELREQIQRLEKVAADFEANLQDHPRRYSQPSPRKRSRREDPRRQRRSPPLGDAAQIRLHAQAALGTGRAAWHSRPGTRQQTFRCALCGVHGPGRQTGARPGQLHARSAHPTSTATPRSCLLIW